MPDINATIVFLAFCLTISLSLLGTLAIVYGQGRLAEQVVSVLSRWSREALSTIQHLARRQGQ